MYEFGPFRLEPAKRILLRGEEPVALTPKAFETLLVLVQNRDRVLLKDELMNRLWPESFVEESNLSQTIFMLRKTLGETAQDQRYIVTVRGTGYRFAEPVREIPDPPLSEAAVEQGPQESFQSSKPGFAWLDRRLRAAAIVLLVVGGLALGGLYMWSPHSPKLTDKDTIVLSEFDNRTGDPIFDGTLKPALAIELEQTPFLSLLPDQRVRATLKLMNRPESERVIRDVAVEICQRANCKAVIAGSIVSIGGEYVLSLKALDCRESGKVIATQQARAHGKEAVLDALGQAAVGLRRDLGESLASVRRFDVPLREATTPSLEALKAFNAGAELQRHGPNQSDAIPFYTHAIELDPNFALAYAYLGRVYNNIGEYRRAVPYIEKAYSFRDRVSEREKLLLTSDYQSDARGDVDKEIETYKIWMEEYPRDWLPVDSLAAVYTLCCNEYEKAAELCRRAIQLDPQQPFSRARLAGAYLALGKTQDARVVLDTAFSLGFTNLPIRAPLYQMAIFQSDAAAAHEQARWSDAQPVQDSFGELLALSAAQQGRLEEARNRVRQDAKELQAAGLNESAALELADLAWIEASVLAFSEMRSDAAASLALFRRSNLATLSTAFALAGDSTQAEALDRELERFASSSPFDQRFTLPGVRASVALSRGHFNEAITLLEPLRRYQLGLVDNFGSLYLRGLAFLRKQDAVGAAAEFQTIIDHRGVSPCSPIWALAHLGLARSRVLAGDVVEARSAYERFFAIWKDADTSLPILKQAREEWGRLPTTIGARATEVEGLS